VSLSSLIDTVCRLPRDGVHARVAVRSHSRSHPNVVGAAAAVGVRQRRASTRCTAREEGVTRHLVGSHRTVFQIVHRNVHTAQVLLDDACTIAKVSEREAQSHQVTL
jgi:hypothetical protein